jgi:hypothetical protein
MPGQADLVRIGLARLVQSGGGVRATACCGAIAVVLLAGCGGAVRPSSDGRREPYPVRVMVASFPASQRLAERTRLAISVRNVGNKPIPDIAVTITNPRYGTAAQAFATDLSGPRLASNSRPVWVVDQAPGPCGYSCRTGGPGAAVAPYSDTWALGRLAPGATARFDWAVTAVMTGNYTVRWAVAAGLRSSERAVLAGGGEPTGEFSATIRRAPARMYVSDSGKIVGVR